MNSTYVQSDQTPSQWRSRLMPSLNPLCRSVIASILISSTSLGWAMGKKGGHEKKVMLA